MQTFNEYYATHKGRYWCDMFYFQDTKSEEVIIVSPVHVGDMVLQKFGNFVETKEVADGEAYHHYFTNKKEAVSL